MWRIANCTERRSLFKVCALLSTAPAEMCLTVVLMLYRVSRCESWATGMNDVMIYGFLPFLSVLHDQAKDLPVSPTVVYRGRCCRKEVDAIEN